MIVPIFTIFLIIILILVIVLVVVQQRLYQEKPIKNSELLEPPSPFKLPIIGHLYLLGGYEVPYQAFTTLGKKFGDIFKLQLGTVKCVVVNDQKKIREALVTRGHHFDSRPNFERYRKLFSGNKENSLAFCDWSATQKARRDMLKAYTFPRALTNNYDDLDHLISATTQHMILKLEQQPESALKPILMKTCANIFLHHFCSTRFDWDHPKFNKLINNFDEIFYEVNQGYAADFLPFLMPLHTKNMQKINGMAEEIREIIIEEVVQDKFDNYMPNVEPADYLENLIDYVKKTEGGSGGLDWETALFALEDIIGGHAAIGNYLTKLFTFLVKEPEVQEKMRNEINAVVPVGSGVSLYHRTSLPYIEAVIYETIRLISSPIVPRVANQDSAIGGYKVEKGTVLFLNNYNLSMSPELWENPEQFQPERFISNGKLLKPDHFLPFGGGRRSCMGYKLVQLVSFCILGTIVQNFKIIPLDSEKYRVLVGSLATKDMFKYKFEKIHD